ncbi:MAG TPA: hypothetical protein VEC94_02420 [Pseudolabrys sp.]|nr:hypothetical protein [Pseudolabrys sp.]
MLSRKTKFLSAAVGVLALIATVAVARTVHTHTTSAEQPRVSTDKVIGTAPTQTTPARRHGIIVCGMAIDSDCEKIEAPM